MREHSILFSTPMVQAILAGKKTQTRRVLDNHSVSVGDVLWVKETWQAPHEYNKTKPSKIPVGTEILYVADRPDMLWDAPKRPSIFMPKWASRIRLKVTEILTQRLQDISKIDAIEEGIVWDKKAKETFGSPVSAFKELWESTYGECRKKRWDANPVVTAFIFKRLSER